MFENLGKPRRNIGGMDFGSTRRVNPRVAETWVADLQSLGEKPIHAEQLCDNPLTPIRRINRRLQEMSESGWFPGSDVFFIDERPCVLFVKFDEWKLERLASLRGQVPTVRSAAS